MAVHAPPIPGKFKSANQLDMRTYEMPVSNMHRSMSENSRSLTREHEHTPAPHKHNTHGHARTVPYRVVD